GAGPGAADLVTLRGLRLIERSPVCLYAGSLVPPEILRAAPAGARLVDTAPLTLDEIVAEMAAAHDRGEDVARLHSGDLSLYGAIAEQMRRLDALGIPYDLTPGEMAQTVILTRTAVRASPMPPGEDLATLGRSGATLVLHLSINNLAKVLRELLPHYGADCPAAVVWRASWPDQRILRGTLATLRDRVKEAGFTRTALILVGRVLAAPEAVESRLYAASHSHVLRKRKQR